MFIFYIKYSSSTKKLAGPRIKPVSPQNQHDKEEMAGVVKMHRERPTEPVKQARRVADRMFATDGQARDGLSVGLIGSVIGRRGRFYHPQSSRHQNSRS